MTSNDASRVAFVTGANQGLGRFLVRALCRQLGDGGVVYLAARSAERGQRAVRQLRDEGLAPVFCQLDVRDGDQVSEAAHTLRERHGGVDIVVSNAALRRPRDRSDAETIRAFIDTNNHGAHRMIRAFGPILNDDARFIVVASAFGRLQYLSAELRSRFDPATMTLEDLERVLAEYVALVEAGQDQEAGWPASINVASKIGQVAAVRIMARDYRDEARRRGLLINAACPAWSTPRRPGRGSTTCRPPSRPTPPRWTWPGWPPDRRGSPSRTASSSSTASSSATTRITGTRSSHGPFGPVVLGF